MTEPQTEPIKVIKTVLSRLPLYYNFLLEKRKENYKYISSTVIAKSLKLNNIQVRKDLACVSRQSGKPRMGFEIESLISDIEEVLGFNNLDEVVLVGAGRLGRTLLSYQGFTDYKLNIVAGFDNSVELVGAKVNNKPILHIDKLTPIVERLNIKIGIITVPKESAQEVCDIMISAGIKVIWNFAPVHLEVPDGIIIKHENLAVSLALLTQKLYNRNADIIENQ
ncbi:MAG: redox-sensing transcriptional repressor Rex [Lentimicrobiaceae bacterium]|nr:redox-sensing transcriptional repressor Rex [Lentimicrobiaceae bacterium]